MKISRTGSWETGHKVPPLSSAYIGDVYVSLNSGMKIIFKVKPADKNDKVTTGEPKRENGNNPKDLITRQSECEPGLADRVWCVVGC